MKQWWADVWHSLKHRYTTHYSFLLGAEDQPWRHYSPGSILTSFLMEHVIDTDKVDEIGFVTGNEAYEQDWMPDRRERFALSCVKPAIPTGRYARFVGSRQRLSKRS